MLGYLQKESELLGQKAPHADDQLSHAVIENFSRRDIVKGLASISGFVLAAQFIHVSPAHAFKPYKTGATDMPNGVVNDPHVFVSIAKDGTVSIVTHRAEMGTGIVTSLPMIIADEMEANWDKVKLVQSDGDEPKYGNQDTDGSRSMRHFIQPMRQIGAAVRYMLEDAAAKKWGVDKSRCRVREHEVVLLKEAGDSSDTGNSISFGELAEAAMAMPAPSIDKLTFKTDDEWRYVGKGEVQIRDIHDITTGKAIYGADVSLPGMKVAVIARPPVVGAKVKAVDDSKAREVPGVEDIVLIDGSIPPAKFAPLGGVAVVAKDTYSAMQGCDALKIEWGDSPHSVYNSDEFKAQMAETVSKKCKPIRDQGDVYAALDSATKRISHEYHQPHISHAAMEPLVALAVVKDGKAEIWAPVQSPYVARQDIAKAIGFDVKDVKVNMTLLGGAFGRKSKGDFATEAALISQKLGGTPVRVQWTREDDMKNGFYPTTSYERLEVAVDKNNKVNGWLHRSAATSFLSTFAEDKGYLHKIEYAMGFVELPYDIPNFRSESGPALSHLRIGWFRSVSNVPRAFAVQSFIAEVAHELGRDHKELLLEIIGKPRHVDPKANGFPEDYWNQGEPQDEYPIDTGRLRHVTEVVCKNAGYGKTLPKGEGLGIAAHRSFVSYVATAVRVKVDDDGNLSVPEVHMAVDCGFCANPERVTSQMEGSCVMGHSLAMHQGHTIVDGVVQEGNYDEHEVARMSGYPQNVQVHIVPHPFSVHASGVGEPGVPPYAPALANAIFNATGKRLRDMPFGDKLG